MEPGDHIVPVGEQPKKSIPCRSPHIYECQAKPYGKIAFQFLIRTDQDIDNQV